MPNVLEYIYMVSIILKSTNNVIKNNLLKLYITTIDCTCPCNPADIFSLESFCSLKSSRGVHFFLGFKCRYPPPRDQFYEWSILVTLNYPLKVKLHLAGTLPQSCRIPSSLHRLSPLTVTDPHLTITHHLGQREPDWDSVLLLGLLHRLVLFTYVRCGSKYLLNLPRKRPNSEHSWKQFIVSLYTLTWALCHYGRSHKADRGSAHSYH